MVHGGVAEGAEDDRVARPRPGDVEARGAVDRERHPDGAREVRGDRRGHREDGELVPAEHLVPAAGDRLRAGRDDAAQDVLDPVDARPGRAGEVERARPVVQQRGIVGPQRERDRGVRLVARRADRVEAPAVLLEPARGVVRLPAVDLRAPDLLRLGRRRDRRGRGSKRPQSPEEVLLERIELVDHGDVGSTRSRAARARPSTRRPRRASSCARDGRTRPAPPPCSPRRRPTPGARTAGARGRRSRRAATGRRPG